MSLAELIVAMALFAVASAIVVGFYASTMRVATLTSNLTVNTKQSSNGMNEISRIVRAGTENPVKNQTLNSPAFVAAENESVTMYAYVNLQSSAQQPIMVRLYIDAQRRLIEQQWKATSLGDGYWGFPATTSTPNSTRVLSSSLSPNVAGKPMLFTFLDADGVKITVPSGGILEAQRRTIAAVTVTITVQGSTSDASSRITLQNTIGIPNLGLNREVL